MLRLAPVLIWEANERPAAFAGMVVPEKAADEPNGADVPASPVSTTYLSTTQPTPTMPTPATATDAMDDLISLMEPEPEPLQAPMPELEASASSSIPSTPDEPQHPFREQEPAPPSNAPSAEHFMVWLKHAIATRKLIINDTKALVHILDNTAFLVTPGLFQRYAQEHPQTAALAKQNGQPDWQWLQKRFEKLGLHRKHPNGMNIWTCQVTGPRKSRRLHGYLLIDAASMLDPIPPNNPYLSLLP